MTVPEAGSGSLAIYVLTCAKSPKARLESAMRQLESFKARCPGLVALIIDGYVDTDAEVDRIYHPGRNRIWSKRSLTRGEIATYATHRKAWSQLIKSGDDAALVLEDDFLITDHGIVLNCLERFGELLSGGRNLIKLFDFPNRNRSDERRVAEIAGVQLAKWYRPRAGMVAYLISRDGAQRLLARAKVFRVVDEDIKYFWELGLDIWSVPGNPVEDNGEVLGGSLLSEARESNRQRHLGQSIKGNIQALHRMIRNCIAYRSEKAKHP